MATLTAGGRTSGRAAERAAWAFYAIAALGSSIGQIWVGAVIPPWPATMPLWLRALLVLPFAGVIDLGGVVCSGFADARQRLGENAYGWRILSAASVSLAVGINVAGHRTSPYLAVVFGGLGVFAYTVWLLHTSARRRDALRASGKLAATAPAYGLWQWRREPEITQRAKSLAAEFGYGLHESLTQARAQLRTEARRSALARHIDTMIRARHAKDPVLAAIAATTTPVDDVAAALLSMIDTKGWARAIAAEIQPPATDPPDPPANAGQPAAGAGQAHQPSTAVLRQIPTQQPDYDRWREIWHALNDGTGPSNQDVAGRFGVSTRTVQRIRDAGRAGLLDSPDTPVARLTASGNGTSPLPPAAA
ncbi:hypothetical protein [Mangrovihabitans endophyticus]|uniref:Homeodomain-like domain-containing protein n=1 Tax=Mangrovihabitans endophyticus TaxID=1751298 RepID=A0A8J3C478_9ACTN|nr:hypothetical protein [Mangrovihabitans endophyticus]GGL12713.1 hypothetical protein GCM10012284_54270 [Mangrovihabitans endophyticus]